LATTPAFTIFALIEISEHRMRKQRASKPSGGPVSRFIQRHYRHYNAAVLTDAARAYASHLDGGGHMMISLAGAMSTAELGLSLAEMIRRDKVHLITCTGANLEEDVFNLVAHNHYVPVPQYRHLSPREEAALFKKKLNRVTDVCIPENEAIRRVERALLKHWMDAEKQGRRLFPHEFCYQLLREGRLRRYYQIDPKDSWMLAAAERNLPIVVPGWEDSSLGNLFAAALIRGDLKSPHTVRGGIEYMPWLADFYLRTTRKHSLGMFQIGGGIAGDFPICVVPMLHQDLKRRNVPLWGYFCQISDSTTSYGSYSGAVPNEKITWGKLGVNTPKFIIESDATIVAPLIFARVLGW
jgi:deoxyhypusine synthase